MKPPNKAPIYASMYQDLAEICREHGYALAVHGSLARDLDIVAVPWAPLVSAPNKVVEALTRRFALRQTDEGMTRGHWGRMIYTLIFDSGFGETFLDLSFMPAWGSKETSPESQDD